MKKKYLSNLIIIILFALSVSAVYSGSGASQTIKNINKKINSSKIKHNIANVLEENTCFDCIASEVLDKYCKKLSDEQCKEIKEVFTEMLKYSTAEKLSMYSAEKIEYLGEESKGSSTIVKTKVISDNRTVKINYELKNINGQWKIVNYIVQDINTIKNYKKQFRTLFRKQSYDKIIKKLKSKLEEYK